MKKNRIVIEVRGGLVEAVYKDIGINPDDNEEVIILDYDFSLKEFDDDQQEALADIGNKKLIKLYEL